MDLQCNIHMCPRAKGVKSGCPLGRTQSKMSVRPGVFPEGCIPGRVSKVCAIWNMMTKK